MEQMLIQVKDQNKFKMLFELLMALNFVDSVQTIPQTEVPETEVEPMDFFSMAGLWEGREVTLASIRQKAWPRQEQ